MILGETVGGFERGGRYVRLESCVKSLPSGLLVDSAEMGFPGQKGQADRKGLVWGLGAGKWAGMLKVRP